MNNMFKVLTVAKKEFFAAWKNKVFITFLLFLLGLIIISIYIGSLNFQSKVFEYQTAYQQLIDSGLSPDKLLKPTFFPLQLLRGAIEYLEIIGSVLAIALGYLSIAKEKNNKALQLIFSRPISKVNFYLGKLFGNSIILLCVVSAVFFFIYIIVSLIGGAAITNQELLKIFVSLLTSWIYLVIFYALSSLLTITLKSLPNSLIISLSLWIIIVLIVPQIGDTMDIDNQVPSGFFNAINVTKNQADDILLQFSSYETTRNTIEEASITKHYERFSFAVLGIKDEYNNKPLSFILTDKFNEIIWLLSYFLIFNILSIISFNKKKII